MTQAAHFRALPRKDLALPATLHREARGAEQARLLNVGLGGACLEVETAPALGEAVQLSVETPVLWDPLEVYAVIAWVEAVSAETYRVGLRFDHERSRAIHALFELLGAEDFE